MVIVTLSSLTPGLTVGTGEGRSSEMRAGPRMSGAIASLVMSTTFVLAMVLASMAAAHANGGNPAASAGAGVAAVRHVSPAGQDIGDCVSTPCRTIGYAISQSISGDTVQVAAGTYGERIVIDRSLTIAGAAPGSTTLDGGAGGTAVTIGSSSTSLKVTISSLTVTNGLAQTGGGMVSLPGAGYSNRVILRNVEATANRAVGGAGADAAGGGIYNGRGSSMTIVRSTVSSNTAQGGSANGLGGGGSGGGIDNSGMLIIKTSSVAGNLALGGQAIGSHGTSGDAVGGGIAGSGPLTLMRATVSGNSATGGPCATLVGCGNGLGGGISGGGTVVNSTVSGNHAIGGNAWHGHAGDGMGGGIRAVGPLLLLNTSVAGNSALPGGGSFFAGTASGGGIDLVNGTAAIANSILADNAADTGPDCDGVVSSGGHNLLGSDLSCAGFTGTGDLVNRDPILGPLQDNGGPTLTMALLPGSPAIDAADDAVCAAPPVNGTDQRGIARPQGPDCDMGAFEAGT